MQEGDFTATSPGDLVQIGGGLLAFVPHTLPPELSVDWRLAQQVEAATRALATLAGTARMLPNSHLLIRPFIRREAVLSSRIEGTQASLSDLLLYEAQGDMFPELLAESQRPASDVREVRNYVLALERGLSLLGNLPLSLRFIRDVHATLMTGVRGTDRSPGEFRRIQVHIGAPSSSAADARFIPPPPGQYLMDCLDAFEKFLHQPSELPSLVRYALIHYQFEAIHPFHDGNGRIGRLLFSLMMVADGHLPQPLLYLSAYFDKHRQAYYDHLLRISTHGEWRRWISFVLDGIAEQAADAVARSARLLDLREDYRRRMASPRSSALGVQLVDQLFLTPFLSINQAARHLNVTHQAASLIVKKLQELGIVREVSGRKRDRIYLAESILAAVDSPVA